MRGFVDLRIIYSYNSEKHKSLKFNNIKQNPLSLITNP